jgi:hypothetical protein
MENKKIYQRVRQHLLLLQNVTMGVQHKLWLHHIEQGNKRVRMLIFYFLVRFGPLIRGSFVYFMYTRVAALCAF